MFYSIIHIALCVPNKLLAVPRATLNTLSSPCLSTSLLPCLHTDPKWRSPFPYSVCSIFLDIARAWSWTDCVGLVYIHIKEFHEVFSRSKETFWRWCNSSPQPRPLHFPYLALVLNPFFSLSCCWILRKLNPSRNSSKNSVVILDLVLLIVWEIRTLRKFHLVDDKLNLSSVLLSVPQR